MSDERLRAIERRVQEGDGDARAELLVERVRLGLLSTQHLTLAAFLGHDPALVASERLGLEVHAERDADYGRWRMVLTEWGLVVAARAAVTAAHYILTEARVTDPRAHELVTALLRWTDDPTLAHFAAVRRLHEACEGEPRWAPQPSEESSAVRPLLCASRAVVEDNAYWAGSTLLSSFHIPGAQPDAAELSLRRAVTHELIPWALRARAAPPAAETLADRVRAGEIPGDRVLLSARVGVPEALHALGADAPAQEPDLGRWLEQLLAERDVVVLRAVCAILELAAPRLPTGYALPRDALTDLRALRDTSTGRQTQRTLRHLAPLIECARAAGPRERPALELFQHGLTFPWLLDPFSSPESDADLAAGIFSQWSGEAPVRVGGETYLLVHGSDGSPVWRVEFEGEVLEQRPMQERIMRRLLKAALDVGLDPEAIRAAVREGVGRPALVADG